MGREFEKIFHDVETVNAGENSPSSSHSSQLDSDYFDDDEEEGQAKSSLRPRKRRRFQIEDDSE